MAPTALWLFKKCPIAVLTATVAVTNGHNVVVAVSFETVTNPVHISSRISYVFLLCELTLLYVLTLSLLSTSAPLDNKISTIFK